MPPRKRVEQKLAAPAKGKTSKKNGAPSRHELALALMEQVNKELKGRAELVVASSLSLPYITKRLPTGLLQLDLALKGGFPAAGVSQIIGPKNAGKSWMYWQVIRQLQWILREKLHVLLAMTELRADRTQGRVAGVAVALADEDIEAMDRARRQNGWPPLTREEREAFRHEIGHIHEAHGMAAEDLYDIILRAVEMGVYHLIVIDSFGNIMSAAEAEADSMHDKTYGGAAGVNTQFLHKLTSLLIMKDEHGRTRDTAIIGINQIRDDIKNANAPYKSSGGRALEHAKFVDLFISSGKPLGKEVNVPLPGGGTGQRFEQWGKEVNWEIKKGKAGIHEGDRASYVYRFHEKQDDGSYLPVNQADFYTDAVIAGVKCGVISLDGTWYTLRDENGRELLKKQGRDAMACAIKEDAEHKAETGEGVSYFTEIRRLCFRKLDINLSYDWD